MSKKLQIQSFEKLQLYGEEPTEFEEERAFNPLDEISERRKPIEDTDFRGLRRRTERAVPQYTFDQHYRPMVRFHNIYF